LNENIFPIPHYSNIPETKLSESKCSILCKKERNKELTASKVKGLPKNSFALQSMAQYNLEPRNGITYLDRPAFNHTNFDLPEIKEIEQNEEYTHAVKLARIEASKVDLNKESYPGQDVEIVTLGTGSSIPAKYRNGNVAGFSYVVLLTIV
jgi:ribonuclease Z